MPKIFRDRKVVVTGGLGFIGSNLTLRLAALGARVTVVDSAVRGCGANPHNLAGASVRLVHADVGDPRLLAGELAGAAAIFNLAGEISHIHSVQFPERDAALNAQAQLAFLQECVRQAPGTRVVYASTRQIYGIPRYLPVDESHPIQPVDFNGVHKYAATAYHRMFTAMGSLDAVVLCLTNVYGPRMALKVPCQGFLANFIRQALLRRRIAVFGDGRQLRDPVYVDDVVDAFLLAAASPAPPSRVYNVGGPEALPLSRIAELMSAAAGAPEPVLRPFPEAHKRIDIGSYATNSTRIREELGWNPKVSFPEGIARTLEYFRRELPHYLDPAASEPLCELGCRAPVTTEAVAAL